jgi:hypothetical protein
MLLFIGTKRITPLERMHIPVSPFMCHSVFLKSNRIFLTSQFRNARLWQLTLPLFYRVLEHREELSQAAKQVEDPAWQGNTGGADRRRRDVTEVDSHTKEM